MNFQKISLYFWDEREDHDHQQIQEPKRSIFHFQKLHIIKLQRENQLILIIQFPIVIYNYFFLNLFFVCQNILKQQIFHWVQNMPNILLHSFLHLIILSHEKNLKLFLFNLSIFSIKLNFFSSLMLIELMFDNFILLF